VAHFLSYKRGIGMICSTRKALWSFALSLPIVLPTAALGVYAPPEAVKADSTITVTGQKQSLEELRQQASAFVKSAAIIPDEDQYARRRDPLCPAVSGIDPQYAAMVVAKVKAVAQAADVKIGDLKCRVNLIIAFTKDSDAYIVDAQKKRLGLLSAMRPDERTALLKSIAPVRWLYATKALGSDGMEIFQGSRNSSILQSESGEPVNLQANRGFQSSYSASLIDTKLIVNLTSTLVVIDVEKSTGFPLDSVAAYAAMVSLAQIKLTSDYSAFPSILSMFSAAKTPDQAPRDLTEWDYAYLRALYKVQPNRTARVQRTRIFGEMVKELAK
jgi:hypothetical protein